MSRARYALYSLAICFLLAGCGQSGPLYMPGNPSKMSVPATEPAESADDEKEEARDSDNE